MTRSTSVARLAFALLLLAAAFQLQVPAALSAECTEGAFKLVTSGPMCSCGGTRTPKDRYDCIGGQWVWTNSTCGPPFCQDPGGGGSCQEQPGSCPYSSGMVCPAYCYCCY